MKRTSTTGTMLTASKKSRVCQGVPYLMKQLGTVSASNEYKVECRDQDITLWNVTINQEVIRPYTFQLANDLIRWSMQSSKEAAVNLDIKFPNDFPKSPPFVRVVWPRFHYQTGHVTVGGSICAEWLTYQGWTDMSVDALIRNILMLFADGKGRIALSASVHHPQPHLEYDETGARDAFRRMLDAHGWRS